MKRSATCTLLCISLLYAACSVHDGAPDASENVGTEESAALLPAQGAPFGYRRGDDRITALVRGADNHIYEMSSSGSDWDGGPWDLFAQPGNAGAPNAMGQPTAFNLGGVPLGGLNLVVYRGTGSRVFGFLFDRVNGWRGGDLTTAASAPVADSNPWGYMRPQGVPAVVYRSGSTIQEISFDGNTQTNVCPTGWTRLALSTLTGSPSPAIEGPTAYLRHGSIPTVVYRSTSSEIIELILYNSGWSKGNLFTEAGGAPLAAGRPQGYARREQNVNAVVYRATNNHIIELSIAPGSNWSDGNLTERTGARLATGDPFGYLRHDGVNAVVYRGTDNRIYELTLGPTDWLVNDLLTAAGTNELASSNPMGFKSSTTSSSVLYKDLNNRVMELRLTSAGWTARVAS